MQLPITYNSLPIEIRRALKKSSKYRNKSCKCLLNHWHDSRLEAMTCDKLLAMVQQKEIKGYKTQVNFDFYVKNKFICSHIVDFVITHNDASLEVYESKGFPTRDWAIKRKLFLSLFPEIKYTVIKEGRG